MFQDSLIGVLLLITHILSCLTVGFIFRFWKRNKTIKNSSPHYNFNSADINISNLGEILSTSIISSIKTILLIGGFVVLFSVILSLLNESGFMKIICYFCFPLFDLFGMNKMDFSNGFFSGVLEVTNGLNIISNINIKHISCNIIISSFILGFGGLSVLLQVYSIISKSNIFVCS